MSKNDKQSEISDLTAVQELAAVLIAQAELTQKEIADRIGVGPVTISRWKQRPDFAAKIKEHGDEIRSEIRRIGIANRENRIKELNDRNRRMKRLIDARAKALAHVDIGGDTGLIVHNVKNVGSGENAERVDIYEFDAALMKEMREHEKQAAIELGEWQGDSIDTSATLTIKLRPPAPTPDATT